MALTITDNSVRQINAALLSLEKKIGETNSEKAQDKQVVQMELKNVQYDFMAPLYQSGNSVSINTTGTWEGNARSATNAEHAITADNGVPTYSTNDAGKNLAVNSSGNAVEWVKPQTIKFVDYKTESLTFSSLTDQKKIELSNFGPEVTEDNVLNFMTIYWNTIHVIAQADWSKSQGTGSSGMACALHSLNTGTGYAVIRCVYLVQIIKPSTENTKFYYIRKLLSFSKLLSLSNKKGIITDGRISTNQKND